MSQRPLASRLARVAGMEGLKWPSSPVTQFPGISQMRKKPRMWSILYAWKYLHKGAQLWVTATDKETPENFPCK